MAEPDRKAEVTEDMRWALAPHVELHASADAATEVAMRHIETAYKNGLNAGRSQTGYRLVQENERLRRELTQAQQERRESPCTTGTAGAAGPTPASTTEADG